MAHSPQGVHLYLAMAVPFTDTDPQDPREGDSFEIAIHTRPRSFPSTMGRCGHLFLCFPAPVQGVLAKEITKFRGGEMHSLCAPSEIEVEPFLFDDGYHMSLFLSSSILYGYDSADASWIGFSYKANRKEGVSQCLTDVDSFGTIPSTWSWARLV
jgi:hypothetical protein